VSAQSEPEGWRVAINQSSVRPTLVLGAEKMPLVLVAALCALPAATGQLRYVAGGIVVWTIALFWLRRLARFDPMLSETFGRYVNYRAYHAAQPSIVAAAAPSHVHQQR
jgi:type IV secretory pathway TrbD component